MAGTDLCLKPVGRSPVACVLGVVIHWSSVCRPLLVSRASVGASAGGPFAAWPLPPYDVRNARRQQRDQQLAALPVSIRPAGGLLMRSARALLPT